jgi:hypothetical protein
MWKKTTSIIGALILLSSLVTGWIWIDSRYAKASSVEANRLDIQINNIQSNIRWYQDQLYYILSRAGVNDPRQLPPQTYQMYCSYEAQKQMLEKQLVVLLQQRGRY